MIQDVMRKVGSSGFLEGQECKYTWDGLCKGDLECGRGKDDVYTCCKDTFIHESTDVCKGVIKEGEKCPSTRDASCAGSLGCALEQAGSNKYICCKKHSIFGGLDYCNNMSDGKICWSDAMCSSGYCKVSEEYLVFDLPYLPHTYTNYFVYMLISHCWNSNNM